MGRLVTIRALLGHVSNFVLCFVDRKVELFLICFFTIQEEYMAQAKRQKTTSVKAARQKVKSLALGIILPVTLSRWV